MASLPRIETAAPPAEGAAVGTMGTRAAWDARIARHHRRVVVALVARGVPLNRAHDAANEAWMRLIEQEREGRLAELELPGLAIKQATFLALERARQERRRRVEPLEESAETAVDPGVDPERRLLSREALRRAEAALSTCAARAKQAFGLVYGGAGLSHAEAGERLGLSEQRVRQILCENPREDALIHRGPP